MPKKKIETYKEPEMNPHKKYKLTYKGSVHIFDSGAFLLDNKKLQGQEYTILTMLVEARGWYITKDQIADKLWDDTFDGDRHNINPRLSQLRSKFGKDGKIIECDKYKYYGQAAYRLNCDIAEINESSTNIFTPYKNSSISKVDRETEYIIRKIAYKDFKANFIHNRSDKFNIAITSDGGIGKTTFSRILYNRLRKHYSSIGWIDYLNSLDDSLIAATDKERKERRDIQLEKIDEFFGNAEKKLLIIDNVIDDPAKKQFPLNEDNGYFTFDKLKDYNNLDIILTTRFKNFPGYTMYPLKELDDISCFELFVYYYDSLENIEEYTTDDYALINKIVSIAHNNSLLIELFARSARNRFFDSLTDMYEYIKADRFKEASVVDKVRDLYRIDTLSQKQQKILWEFAILPNMSLNGEDLKSLLKIKPNDEDFRYLIDRGWISVKGKSGCSMHDIIKESIIARSSVNPNKQHKQDDYLDYSYCYDNNTSGFAPDFCYSDIRSTDVMLDRIDNLLRDVNLSFADVKKRVDLLIAIVDHIKMNNLETGYYYSLCGYYTFHKLGDKHQAEKYLRNSLKCLNDTRENANQENLRSLFYINGICLGFNGFYTLTSYNLSYALSSMGYNRLTEAYELMESTLKALILKDKTYPYIDDRIRASYITLLFRIKFDYKKYQGAYLDQIIVNEFDNICKQTLNNNFELKRVFSYNLLARIFDHAAYIATISKPEIHPGWENILLTALKIRETIHGFHSLREMSELQLYRFMEPYREFIENIYDLLQVPGNLEIFKRHCEFHQDSYRLHPDSRFLGSEFPIFLKNRNISEHFEFTKIDIAANLFGFYSYSNYIESLQDLATTEDNLGYFYIQMGRYEAAFDKLIKALAHRTRLEQCEPHRHLSELSWTNNNLGELCLRQYEETHKKTYIKKAIEYYEQAIFLRHELNKQFKNRYLDNLAWSYIGLWRCYLNIDDVTKAEEYRNNALSIYKDLNTDHQYDNDIKLLNSKDPLAEPINWVGNQSHFRPTNLSL